MERKARPRPAAFLSSPLVKEVAVTILIAEVAGVLGLATRNPTTVQWLALLLMMFVVGTIVGVGRYYVRARFGRREF